MNASQIPQNVVNAMAACCGCFLQCGQCWNGSGINQTPLDDGEAGLLEYKIPANTTGYTIFNIAGDVFIYARDSVNPTDGTIAYNWNNCFTGIEPTFTYVGFNPSAPISGQSNNIALCMFCDGGAPSAGLGTNTTTCPTQTLYVPKRVISSNMPFPYVPTNKLWMAAVLLDPSTRTAVGYGIAEQAAMSCLPQLATFNITLYNPTSCASIGMVTVVVDIFP